MLVNPERLLDALRSREDERLKGFRSNAFEKLERYLRENGYVDEHLVLDGEELRLRALASPAATHLAVECLGDVAGEAKEFLDEARRRNLVPEYSLAWCLENKFLPGSVVLGGEKI